MSIGISIIAVILALIIINKLISFGLKIVVFTVLAVLLGATIFVCSAKPDMHKPFSLNTIEYLLKVNKDGSVSTTKQVTKTVYKEQTK